MLVVKLRDVDGLSVAFFDLDLLLWGDLGNELAQIKERSPIGGSFRSQNPGGQY